MLTSRRLESRSGGRAPILPVRPGTLPGHGMTIFAGRRPVPYLRGLRYSVPPIWRQLRKMGTAYLLRCNSNSASILGNGKSRSSGFICHENLLQSSSLQVPSIFGDECSTYAGHAPAGTLVKSEMRSINYTSTSMPQVSILEDHIEITRQM